MAKCSLLGCIVISYIMFLFVVYVELITPLTAEYMLIPFILTIMGVAIYDSLFGGA